MHNVGLGAYLRELRLYVVQVGLTTSIVGTTFMRAGGRLAERGQWYFSCASIKLINRNPHESGIPITVGLQELLSLPARQKESGVLKVPHAEVASDQNTPKVE